MKVKEKAAFSLINDCHVNAGARVNASVVLAGSYPNFDISVQPLCSLCNRGRLGSFPAMAHRRQEKPTGV
jgi:hypothetical protein